MPAIYVLDVPEFSALVTFSRQKPEYRVGELGNGYYRIESDTDLVFNRRELKFKPAVWYGIFTGGLDGRIVQFDRDLVRIVAQ